MFHFNQKEKFKSTYNTTHTYNFFITNKKAIYNLHKLKIKLQNNDVYACFIENG